MSFHEVTKLKKFEFEFDVSDVITANVKTSSHWFFLHVFLNLWRKPYEERNFNKFLWRSWLFFGELIKFQHFESLNCFSTLLISFTQINMHNILIMDSIQTFGIFS